MIDAMLEQVGVSLHPFFTWQISQSAGNVAGTPHELPMMPTSAARFAQLRQEGRRLT